MAGQWQAWVIVGLFTRTFQYGTDHLAFQLTESFRLQAMIQGIYDYYPAWWETTWHPFKTLSGTIVIGWIVLAIGAYRSGALGLGR